MASFVQTRGSVPIFWTEIYNLRYKPDLKIMDVPQTQESMKAHFNQQVKIYGDQYLVNLVNSSGCEKPVKYYYERGVRELGNPRH
ncbi:SAC domain-containing protein [Phakopsora pachyrhizi]|uniref:SAC domain-containing protein n=1 Tax=Phakopsora pachyrhizi TaxID=170000 RepID=A0AAV0BPY5_PHAPC|nr:SAC domain-containing protein [Phakopsora pachyrhizi]